MSEFAYDPDNWLVTSLRMLEAWVRDQLEADAALGGIFDVEMSFPDTTRLAKANPLRKVLIHFELDDIGNPRLGFGKPGVSVYDAEEGTELFSEAARHLLNFDVGVWASAESGGGTKRMQARQALSNLFASETGREAFNEATEGLSVVSFEGGHDILDKVNDLPVWRTSSMTLVIEVFSRHTPAEPSLVPLELGQEQLLTIIASDGEPEPLASET